MELAFASILYRMLAQLTKPPPTQARSIWRDAVVVVHSSPAWKCAPALDRDQTSEKWLKRNQEFEFTAEVPRALNDAGRHDHTTGERRPERPREAAPRRGH